MANPLNILLIEDNDVDVDMVRRGLKKIKAEGALVRARDGQEALEILLQQPLEDQLAHPFVVLLDINMPRMNGHEFLYCLRQDPRISDTRVIVFTTSDNPKDVARAYDQNAVGYFVKPDTSRELRAALQTIWDFWDRCTHPPRKAF